MALFFISLNLHNSRKHKYVLNSNSILDCGEWTDNGLVFEHEGGYNTYHNATLSTTSQDYREDIQANNTLDSEINENLDVVIINS